MAININMNNVHSAAALCDDQEIAGILNRLEALVTDDPETEERAALEAAMREELQRREDEFCLLSSSGFPRRALHALDTLPDGETPWKAARRRVSALVKTPGAIVAPHGPRSSFIQVRHCRTSCFRMVLGGHSLFHRFRDGHLGRRH